MVLHPANAAAKHERLPTERLETQRHFTAEATILLVPELTNGLPTHERGAEGPLIGPTGLARLNQLATRRGRERG